MLWAYAEENKNTGNLCSIETSIAFRYKWDIFSSALDPQTAYQWYVSKSFFWKGPGEFGAWVLYLKECLKLGLAYVT